MVKPAGGVKKDLSACAESSSMPETTHRGPARPLAIYDGECRACAGFAKVVKLLDVHGRLRLVPAQDPEPQRLFPLEELRRTFHVVLPDGRALVHGDALATVVGELPALSWLPDLVERSRHLRHLTNRVYGWLARNRPWISHFA